MMTEIRPENWVHIITPQRMMTDIRPENWVNIITCWPRCPICYSLSVHYQDLVKNGVSLSLGANYIKSRDKKSYFKMDLFWIIILNISCCANQRINEYLSGKLWIKVGQPIEWAQLSALVTDRDGRAWWWWGVSHLALVTNLWQSWTQGDTPP